MELDIKALEVHQMLTAVAEDDPVLSIETIRRYLSFYSVHYERHELIKDLSYYLTFIEETDEEDFNLAMSYINKAL